MNRFIEATDANRNTVLLDPRRVVSATKNSRTLTVWVEGDKYYNFEYGEADRVYRLLREVEYDS